MGSILISSTKKDWFILAIQQNIKKKMKKFNFGTYNLSLTQVLKD